MSSSPPNCATVTTIKSDLINAACSTTQNVTLSANFNEQRIRTKHDNDCSSNVDDDVDNEAKEVNVDTNLQQVSKRTRKRSFNCSNNEAEEGKTEDEVVKVSLANYNSNNENFPHENDDANGKCLTGQTNEADYVSRHGGTGLEKDLSLKSSDELLTNNNGKQRTQSSVIVGSLKVRDEFIESNSQSYTQNMRSDAGDTLQQLHMHHSIKVEEEEEEEEEGNNTVRNRKNTKRSRSRSPNSSNSSIILPATNSNHSIVHNVGGGSISKDKTTLRKHHEKHTKIMETEKFTKIKGKFH